MNQSNYFQKYLTVAPFALALWRAPEAETIFRCYQQYKKTDVKRPIKFNKPVLDVGCGFGEFAGVFFDTQVEMGIDISLEDLLLASKVNKYKKLLSADARKMPFKKNSFATVLSVSVLEHIINPHEAINEIYRVLKPGGIFIYTVPTVLLNEYLFYPTVFKKIGLPKLADIYLKRYHHIFKHVSLFYPHKWLQITRDAGFEIIKVENTYTPVLTRIFDFFLITSLPSQICRWLIGSRWIWGLPWKKLLVGPIYNYALANPDRVASNIFVLAKKPK